MSETIDVVIDGLSVPVDAVEYRENPDKVEDEVRAARLAAAIPADDSEDDFESFDKVGDVEDEGVPAEEGITPDTLDLEEEED